MLSNRLRFDRNSWSDHWTGDDCPLSCDEMPGKYDGDSKFIYTKVNSSMSLHRYMASLHYGEWSIEGKVVCHSCDNPYCGNPRHLWTGTQGDNMRDKMSKGRQSFFGGNALTFNETYGLPDTLLDDDTLSAALHSAYV